MWFQKLTGFKEESPEQVRENLQVEGEFLTSSVNGKSYRFGQLETPTLAELRSRTSQLNRKTGQIQVSELVANVQTLHLDPTNQHALFQAASQFNLLEMVSPVVPPEMGVGIYEEDLTQGPACAIACGAGTIYRNYFAEVNGQQGQTMDDQIDCLDLIGEKLDNWGSSLWEMRNGYALLHPSGLREINAELAEYSREDRENLKGLLKIGLQWDTEVTLARESGHLVNQAYCAALPISYSEVEQIADCEVFARLILEATYEATFHSALLNLTQRGCPKVYLTLVGGGVFGNKMEWIMDSIYVALQPFLNTPLEVKIVSFGAPKLAVRKLLRRLSE